MLPTLLREQELICINTFLKTGTERHKKLKEVTRPSAAFWGEQLLEAATKKVGLFLWDTRLLVALALGYLWLRSLHSWAPLALIALVALPLTLRLMGKTWAAPYVPGLTDFERLARRRARRKAQRLGCEIAGQMGLIKPDEVYKIFAVTDEATLTLTVEQPIPGLSFQRYEAKLNEFGADFGSVRTVSENLGKGRFKTVLHLVDPLDGVRHAQPTAPTLSPVVGRKEDGENLIFDLTSASHTAIQGQTRSGKSVFCYTALSQVVGHPEAEVWGIDPNAVLLAPIAEATNPARFALDMSKLDEPLEILRALVEELDTRIQALREQGLDKLSHAPETPLIVLVLEEYPGLIRANEVADRELKPAERRTPKIKALVGRLVSEGAKVGFRVILITQRADAEILDGATRAQMGQRLSFGVDNLDAVKMLHPSVDSATAERVESFKNGRCLVFQDRDSFTAQIDLTEYEDYKALIRRNVHESVEN